MPRIPKPPAVLRALARAALPQIYDLFRLQGGNRIQVFNQIRGWFNLSTQAQARDLFNFAVDIGSSLEGLNRETALGSITIADVPINPTVIDPTGLGRRFRYEITAEVNGTFINVGFDEDQLLSQADLELQAYSEVIAQAPGSPKISRFFLSVPEDDIEFRIARLERRY